MSHSYAVFCSPAIYGKTQESLLRNAFLELGLNAKYYPVKSCSKVAGSTKADVLVAAGGDGTVNCVAGQAYKHNKPLGVVALGTLNHFAKDLGLPLVILQDVKVLAQGKTKKIDIGVINNRIFLNNSSVGIYPDLVRSRQKFENIIGKWPAAFVSVVLVARNRLQLHNLSITIDGKKIKRKSSLFFVGNNIYNLDSLGLAARDKLSAGKLHVFLLKTKRIDRLLKTAMYNVAGKRPPEAYIERFTGKKIEIKVESKKYILAAYDGEIAKFQTPFVFELKPKALMVITPN